MANSEETFRYREEKKFHSNLIGDVKIIISLKVFQSFLQELGCLTNEDCEFDSGGTVVLFLHSLLMIGAIIYSMKESYRYS